MKDNINKTNIKTLAIRCTCESNKKYYISEYIKGFPTFKILIIHFDHTGNKKISTKCHISSLQI